MGDERIQTRRELHGTKETTTKKKSGRWRTILGVLLILVAAALLAVNPVKNYFIEKGTEANRAANITREQIEANQDREVTFNWDDISTLDAASVFANHVDPNSLPVIGAVAMPELDMNLPIHKGVSEAGMFYGAGTLYPDMVMGQGNYSIASHHSIHEGMLFAPLLDAQMGQKIYLTDLDKVYVYEVDFVEHVSPDRVDLTYPTESARVTLITCDAGLVNRVVVQGALVDEFSIYDADQEVLEAFNIPETVPQ